MGAYYADSDHSSARKNELGHGQHHTRSLEANLLDDGRVDTLVVVGPTIALPEIPWPNELVWWNTRETSDIRAVCWCGDALVLNHSGEMDTRVVAGEMHFDLRRFLDAQHASVVRAPACWARSLMGH